ncbi:MAG TPA: choice-of-anchor Q domain-containing protein [Terriglobales bacterium]|nr:choice-of-anchor Q domain-containing protein [Terriglobales bacterium]
MRTRPHSVNFFLLLALFVALVPNAVAGTWYVDGTNGSDSNDCKSPATACQKIQSAIGLAVAGDTINIAASTYKENLTIGLSVKLTGAGPATTIIDGGLVTRTITIAKKTAHVSLSALTIQNGVSSNGGGILNLGALTISNCTISGNSAVSSSAAAGGGLFNTGKVIITGSTFSGNNATSVKAYGGAILNGGRLSISNSTFSGNTESSSKAIGGGGAIANEGIAYINNSTFSGNSGVPAGGAIFNDTGTATIQNSIFANSPSGGNCSGTMTSMGYNLSSDSSCGFSAAGDRNGTNPNLGPLQNNGGPTLTMALPSGSPAIDAGNPAGCKNERGRLLKTDQRGQPRPDKEDTVGCDIGAYESPND